MQETAAAARCAAALADVGAAPDGAARAAVGLVGRYQESRRRYHTLVHVAAVLDGIDALVAAGEPVADLAAVRVAAWYHDAVVTLDGGGGGADGDEARSAALAADDLDVLGVARARVEHVAALVRATARHEASTADAAVLVDADLAILAAEPADYAAYAKAVRDEYAAVGDAAFRAGRVAVLRRLLDRERLFATVTMAGDAEARARHNLAAELAGLLDHAGQPPPESFTAAVHAVVAATAPGEVLTYGDVAAEAGRPGAARAVGAALRRSHGLPWWRVVNASGRLVPGHEGEHAARLRAEGVRVRDGRVRRR